MTTQDSLQLAQLEARAISGARWFYWIAALSFITSVVAHSGSQWGFVISLGVTQVIDGFAKAAGADTNGIVKAIALILDLIVAGVFVLFGVFAGKKHLWAFIVGMVLFGLDTLLLLLAQDWIAIAFHAYALFCIFGGYNACRKFFDLQSQAKTYSEIGVEQESAATISG